MSETGNIGEPRRMRGSSVRLSNLLKRASSLAEQGMYDEAIENLQEAMAICPHDPKCSVELANIYRTLNRIGPAIEAMQRAVELDPRDQVMQEQLLETLLELGRYEEVISASEKLLMRSPKNILARDMLGLAYVQQGMLDKALKVTNELIQIAPADPVNHFKKAVLLQQKGELAQAMAIFLRVIEMDPEGEVSDDAREMVAALDSYQLRQILTIAVEDIVFRTKLSLDADSAVQERGFRLSQSGLLALRQIDIDQLPGESRNVHYH